MNTIGQTLVEAREKKGVTTSEAAAATRIKVQHIEDLERNDFSNIAAATYAKGFIKLYADYLDLDSQPLIKEYMEYYAPRERVPLEPDAAVPASTLDQEDESGKVELVSRLREGLQAFASKAKAFLVKKGLMIGGIVVAVWILSGLLRQCGGTAEQVPAAAGRAAVKSIPAQGLIAEPPEPYLEPE